MAIGFVFVFFVLFLFVLGIVAAYTLIGMARRTRRSLVSLISTVASITLAVVLTFVLASVISNSDTISFASYIDNEELADFFESSNATRKVVAVLASALAAPVIFVVSFIVLKVLFIIPGFFIRAAIKKRETEEYRKAGLNRGMGALIGFASAILVFVPFLISFSAYYGLAYDFCYTIQDGVSDINVEELDLSTIQSFLPDERSGFWFTVYDGVAKPFIKGATGYEVDGEKGDGESLAMTFAEAANKLLKTLEATDKIDDKAGKKDIERVFNNVLETITIIEKDPLLHDVGPDLLEYLAGNKDVSDKIPIDADVFNDLADAMRDSYDSAMKMLRASVKASVIAIELSSDTTDENVISENITWLVKNMDQGSADVIKKSVKSLDVFDSVNEATSEKLTEAVENLCDKLASAKNMTEEESDKNAAALKKLYEVGIEATKSDNTGLLFGNTLPTADEIVADICDSTIISEVVTELVFDENGNAVENPLGTKISLGEVDKSRMSDAISAYELTHPDVNEKVIAAMSELFLK